MNPAGMHILVINLCDPRDRLARVDTGAWRPVA